MIKFTGLIPEWLQGFFRTKMGYFYKNSYLLGQKGALWIEVDKPYILYNEIPQLKAVIDRKASMFANMELKLIDKNTGEVIEDKDLIKLIDNPNPLQSQNDWLRQFKMQEQVYGNQFIYKNKPSRLTKYPVTLFNISPRYVKPYSSGKIWDQVNMVDIILKYEYYELGKERDFKTEEILYSRLNDLDNPIIGCSPILSLKFPLTNTKLAYEYRNVIMSEKGAIGLLANESKDSMGSVPLTTEEKTRIESQYRNDYGIGLDQKKILITDASLKWTPMTYPTKDLLLFEEVDANHITIVDHFGLNINMFSSKNATFENVKNSIIQVYQDTIIPEADQFTQNLGKFIGIPENTKLIASYEHLSILKENKQKGMAAIQSMIQALNQAVQSGLLSAAQAQIIIQNELSSQVDLSA